MLHFFITLFFIFPAHAEKAQKPGAKKPPPEQRKERSLERLLIDGDIAISQGIDSIADTLDVYLANKRYVDKRKKNPTTVRISNSTYSSEGVRPRNATHLGVNLRLPNVEKSWALRFTTYDENEEDRGVRRNTLRGTPRPENYGTSVALFKQLGDVNVTFRPRIELRDPLRVSQVLRFENDADMKTYKIKPKIELFATPTKGTGVFTALNFEWELSPRRTISWINEGEYEDGRNLFSVDNGLSLSQAVSEYAGISYSALIESSSRERYHMDQYVFATSWRHVLYKRVLEYQLTPSWAFPKSRQFKGSTAAAISFSLIF